MKALVWLDLPSLLSLAEACANGGVLTGAVRSWAERQEAEKAAWRAPGVTSVNDLVTVRAAA